jgi:hypothetical protein
MKVPSSMPERNAASQEEIDEAAVACFSDEMRAMLVGHLPKENAGNFFDLAILAMMLHARGADPAILREAIAEGGAAIEPWRRISEAVKDGNAIWAMLKEDIVGLTGCPDLAHWNGIQVPLRHPGVYTDDDGRDRDHGWTVAAPVGHGGIPDDWIAGWVPMR